MKVITKLDGFVFVLILIAALHTESRKAIKKPLDVLDLISELSHLLITDTEITTESPASSSCRLNIQKDLPKPNEPQPLYIKPFTNQFWLPNSDGHLEIPQGATIELYCSKFFKNITDDNNNVILKIPYKLHTIRPTCLYGNTFSWWGQKYQFHQFICAQQVKFSVEQQPNESCGAAGGAAQMYRVGFNITKARFIETMRICHDDNTLRTHYTQHLLQPANLNYQKFVKRLNFSKAGFFTQHNINFFYTQKNQHQQAIAGNFFEGPLGRLFDNKTLFLARGHLTAKADMIYANQQRTTFTFFNVAPQWQSFNGGQWAALEDELRKFVAKSQLEVIVFTGTIGVLELRSFHDNAKKPFYLNFDENNNGILPVPQLFYRVVVDNARPNRGVALVGVNNPFANLDEINDSYVICDDVREEIPWLRWIRNRNLKKGYLYACKVNDFVKAVNHLPMELNDVDELLLGK